MTREQIRAFVTRDWARLAAVKARTWQAGKQSPTGDLHAADQLRRHALSVRPDWPSLDDRADDLRNHIRVSEALSAIAIRFR
jgi:hypothetical protein